MGPTPSISFGVIVYVDGGILDDDNEGGRMGKVAHYVDGMRRRGGDTQGLSP